MPAIVDPVIDPRRRWKDVAGSNPEALFLELA
jgi:hypothetical protein